MFFPQKVFLHKLVIRQKVRQGSDISAWPNLLHLLISAAFKKKKTLGFRMSGIKNIDI